MINRNSNIALVITILALSLACTRSQNPEPSIERSDRYQKTSSGAATLRTSWQYQSLDWQKTDNRIIDNIMDGLIQYDFSKTEVDLKPGLALRWTASAGGRRWTIDLRRDASWSDGVPFTGEHIVEAWRRALDPKTAAHGAYFLYPIKNARAFNLGRCGVDSVGIKMRGPYKIEIELETPIAFFPYLLTNAATYPIRADLIAKFGEQWSQAKNLVTLGAYRIVEEKLDRSLVLTQNPNYYDRAHSSRHGPKDIFIHLVDDGAALNLFESGKLDLAPYVPPALALSISNDLKPKHYPVLSVHYLGFGTSNSSVSSPLVRRAISLAINRADLAAVAGGRLTALSDWIPAGLVGHKPDAGSTFDLATARKLLAQAGYPEGKGLPTIEMAIYEHEDQLMAENLQFQLKKLGVHLDIRFVEWKTLVTRFKTDPPATYLHGWDMDFPDQHNMFDILSSRSGNNHTQWRSEAYDRLLNRAAGAMKLSLRQKLYDEARVLLLERDVPAIPLFTTDRTYLLGPRVAKYPTNPLGKIVFKDIEMSTAQ